MDIQKIKEDFKSYLIEKVEKEGDEGKIFEYEQMGDISIFTHAKEFKEYLMDEFNLSSEVLYMNITDIKDMEIQNGRLVNPEEEAEKEEDFIPADKEEISEDAEASEDVTEEGTAEEFSMQDVFNLLLADEAFISKYDSDGNGEIGEEEFNAFQESAKGLDGNDENLSMDDIIGSFELKEDVLPSEAIPTQEEGKAEVTPKAEETPKTKDTSKTEETPKQEVPKESKNNADKSKDAGAPASTNSSARTSASDAPKSVSGAQSTAKEYTSTPIQEKNLDEMTVEELNDELTQAEADLSDKRAELDKVVQGELKEAMDKNLEAYNKALEESENENAQELAEVNKQLAEKEQALREKDTAISDKEAEVNAADEAYKTAESNLKSLEAQQQVLNNTDTSKMSETQKADLERKKSEIAKAVETAKSEKERLQNDKETKEKELEELKEEKTKLEQESPTLDELEGQKTELEQKISTLLASEPFAELKATYEESKNTYETAIDKAKTEITTAQERVTEVNNALRTAQAKENEKTFSANVSEFDGQELLDKINELGYPATKYLSNLCEGMGMDEKEVVDLLTKYSMSEEWGNGCVTPLMLFAQICNESGGKVDAKGDKNSQGEYLAIGLGQFHPCAVDEVNIRYGTNYTYEDRSDPIKALEMMSLLLKYDYTSTGNSTIGMYTKYASGHDKNRSIGERYYGNIQRKIGLIP